MDSHAWNASADVLWDAIQKSEITWDSEVYDRDLKAGLAEYVNHWNTLSDTEKSMHTLSDTGLYNLVQVATG